MKKKTVAILLLLSVYFIYLVFLFFFPNNFININNEIKITKAIGDFLSKILYLKAITGMLINKYTLIAVFFFILGFIYGKKRPFIFGLFIVFSAILYFLIFKINNFINFNYGLKEFFPLCFSLYTFFFYSQEKKEGINYILVFFVIFSFLFLLFFRSVTISGILIGFLASLFLGKGFRKLNRLFF